MEVKQRQKAKQSVYFSTKQKHTIIQDFLESGLPKQRIWEKYTGEKKEKGKILKFMRQLGYIEDTVTKKPVTFYMDLPKTKDPVGIPLADPTNDRIRQLEQQLRDSRLREQAYLMMIQVAERDMKIDIRKKSYTR